MSSHPGTKSSGLGSRHESKNKFNVPTLSFKNLHTQSGAQSK